MSRIGSIYARRWPISGGRQLRLALVAGALLVATGAARASQVCSPAAAPGILPSANIVVQSGGPQSSIQAVAPANPQCPITDYRWTALTPSAPQLMTNGASASFDTPKFLCQRDGASYVYRVEALDSSGVASEPRDFTVQLKPWGQPLAPFAIDPQVNLAAGAGAVLTPDQTHPCSPTSGFPGLDTQWALPEGQLLPPGIRLRTPEGTLVTGPSAVTPQLQIETDACAAGQVTLLVNHYTRDGSGVAGPVSTVQVNVDPQWVPISNGVLMLDADAISPERIAGTASVEGLNCIEQRGGVKARMSLRLPDGTLVQQKEFRIPSPWEFSIAPMCGGQHFRLETLLVEGPGFTAEALQPSERYSSANVSQLALLQTDIIVPPIELSLRPSEAAHLVASCGQAASGTLEQRLPAGPCSGSPLTWEYVSGPELTQSSFTGEQIQLTTRETDFGALLGQSVVMRVSVDTGKVSQMEQTVPITAEPFVTVDRHVENAVGADTDLTGVSVDLHNTTECGVGQVDHVERLAGVDYVPGSARFNDAPVEAELDGETLTVRGLTLEGGATGRLTYVVRPRLLGASSFEGQSFVRGIPVSQPPPESPSGYGCDGSGSGVAALGLAGLAAVLRRRRAR
ncbi:MAG: hypothetical protein ACJ8AT_03115 [Hyalangium sp.]|uniref:hypothetical protein n=1 Tax=Hyalangium sp. TaxID=2028555 RepID=UPI00389AC77B